MHITNILYFSLTINCLLLLSIICCFWVIYRLGEINRQKTNVLEELSEAARATAQTLEITFTERLEKDLAITHEKRMLN